jgi:hypothetical protein
MHAVCHARQMQQAEPGWGRKSGWIEQSWCGWESCTGSQSRVSGAEACSGCCPKLCDLLPGLVTPCRWCIIQQLSKHVVVISHAWCTALQEAVPAGAQLPR